MSNLSLRQYALKNSAVMIEMKRLRNIDKSNNEREKKRFIEKIENSLMMEYRHYIIAIENIPDLNDTMNLVNFSLNNFSYYIINPDVSKRDEYKVYVYFISEELNLLEIIGDKLLLSKEIEESKNNNTFLLKLDDSVSISSYRSFEPSTVEPSQ